MLMHICRDGDLFPFALSNYHMLVIYYSYNREKQYLRHPPSPRAYTVPGRTSLSLIIVHLPSAPQLLWKPFPLYSPQPSARPTESYQWEHPPSSCPQTKPAHPPFWLGPIPPPVLKPHPPSHVLKDLCPPTIHSNILSTGPISTQTGHLSPT